MEQGKSNSEITLPKQLESKEKKKIFFNLLNLSFLNVLSFILGNFVDLITLHFVSRLNDSSLTASEGLSKSWYSLCNVSIISGLLGPLNSFIPNYFGSKRNDKLNASFLIGLILSISTSLIIILILNISPFIMRILNFNDELIPQCTLYLEIISFNIIPNSILELFKIYINGINKLWICTFANTISVLLHPSMCYIFILHLDYGFAGAAISKSITSLINLILILILCMYLNILPKIKMTLHFVKEEFKEYFKMMTDCIIVTGLDWWAYELITILSAKLSSIDVASNVILQSMNLQIFMISNGIGYSSQALVGQAKGSNQIKRIPYIIKVSNILNTILVGISVVLIYIFQDYVISFYTNDQNVVNSIKNVFIFWGFVQLFDTNQGICSKIINGLGFPNKMKTIVIISYYFVLIPFLIIFSRFIDYGVFGITIAIFLGAFSMLSLEARHLYINKIYEEKESLKKE